MKRLLAALMLVAFAATAFADDTVVMKAKNGDVSFNHKMHGEKMECALCHGDGAPGKIAMGKDKAHTLCKNCHTKEGGPTKCGDCHK